MVPFTRQLGPRSGIQLNPVRDDTERFVGSNVDQIFGAVGCFERGRIDKAFRVNRGNLRRLLGNPASTQVSRLNEAYVHIYDTLQNGGYEGVVYRLNTEDAVLSYMVCKSSATANDVWSVAATPVAPYLLAIKHLECFNDGVKAEINAEPAYDTDGVTPVASKIVNVRLRDKKTGDILYDFTGSLDVSAVDEFGESTYLPNVAAMQTENVEITVGATAEVAPSSAFYGSDANRERKFVGANLSYFSEGGTSYTLSDYDRAMSALKYSVHNFGYLEGAGTRAVALLSKLAMLGKEINKQFCWDVPGEYGPEAAIAFYNQLNIDNHYSQAYWAPLMSNDPLNGGKAYIGMSCINVGMRCLRNASTDANGIPPKNYPVAMKFWPIQRTGIVQKYTPSEQELDDLARARINPVLFVSFDDGGKYVFVDSLTGAKTEADRKLIAVADMSSHVDDAVTRFAQGVLQLPMQDAIKRTTDFLQSYFESIEAAKWILPSPDRKSPIFGKAFAFTVQPNNMRPKDRMDISYWLYYDGTARAIYVQQTISK